MTPPLVLSEEKYFSILSQITVCHLNQAQVRTVLALWLLEQRCSYSFTSYSLEAVNLKVKLNKKTHTHCNRKQNISQLEVGIRTSLLQEPLPRLLCALLHGHRDSALYVSTVGTDISAFLGLVSYFFSVPQQ